MKYIYDILLNWTDVPDAYEFYEWQLGDDLEHIKKIPVIKTDVDTFCVLYNSKFEISNDILEQLKNKTELFNNKIDNYIDCACVFTDGLRAIAIEFDKKGRSIYRSNLLLDEEEEVLDISGKMEEMKINYKIVSQNKEVSFLTRKERIIKKYLINEFNKIYKTRNIKKLKYLYYEWYNTACNDFDMMFDKIKQILDIEWNQKHINLYNLIKLSDVKK